MPSSNTDTACSTPDNDTVEKIVKNDAVRYVKKGYGLVMAICITLSFFGFAPIALKNIWPHFLELADIKVLVFFTVFMIPVANYLVANLIMWFIYVSEIPFFERYRINPDKPWPWQKDSVQWRKTVRKTIKNLFVNQLVIAPAMAAFDVWVTGSKSATSVESFPDHWTVITHITFMMIVEDFIFYWGHRFLHTPWLYQKIHKIHHEYFNTISLCAEYAHPLEFSLCNVLPTSAGYLILGSHVHLATFAIWLSMRQFETIDGHCGYEFSWSPYRLLPLSGSSEYHNFHHSHNVGSYCSFFTYLDTIFQTNKDYFVYKARKERLLKQREIQQEFSKNGINHALLQKKLDDLKED